MSIKTIDPIRFSILLVLSTVMYPDSFAAPRVLPQSQLLLAQAANDQNAAPVKDERDIQSLLFTGLPSPDPTASDIILAASAGNLSAVKQLIAGGADVSQKTILGDLTALHYAASKGYEEITDLLLRARAAVNASDDAGVTPLLLAAAKGHVAVTRLLLQHGADVNLIGKRAPYTPLSASVIGGNSQVLSLLLAAGSDPDVVGPDRLKPVELAEGLGRTNLVAILDRTYFLSPQGKYPTRPDRDTRKNAERIKAVILQFNPATPITDLSQAINRKKQQVNAAKTLDALTVDDVPALLSLVSDRSKVVARTAVKALKGIGPPAHEASPMFIQMLRTEESVRFKRLVVEGLGSLWREIHWRETYKRPKPHVPPEVITALVSALEDTNTDLAFSAADSLARIKAEANASVPALLRTLSATNELLRANAAHALGAIGPDAVEAIPQLMQLLRTDVSEDVRSFAGYALPDIIFGDESSPYLRALLSNSSHVLEQGTEAQRLRLKAVLLSDVMSDFIAPITANNWPKMKSAMSTAQAQSLCKAIDGFASRHRRATNSQYAVPALDFIKENSDEAVWKEIFSAVRRFLDE